MDKKSDRRPQTTDHRLAFSVIPECPAEAGRGFILDSRFRGNDKAIRMLRIGVVVLGIVLFPLAGYAATVEETARREKTAAASKAALKKAMVSKEVSAPETVIMAESTVAVPATGNVKKEPTDFQKRMEALAQGKTVESLEKKAPAKKEAPKIEEPEPIEKKIAGTVTGMNSRGIAIQYASDAESGGMELWINFDKKVQKAGGLKELGGLEVGDRVNAVYDEYPNKSKKLTGIKLVRKKPPEKETPAEEAEEEA